MGGLGPDAARDIVKRAFNAGVNFIDTANVYARRSAFDFPVVD